MVAIITTVIEIEKIMLILQDTKNHDKEEEALVLNTIKEEKKIIRRDEGRLSTTRDVGIDWIEYQHIACELYLYI